MQCLGPAGPSEQASAPRAAIAGTLPRLPLPASRPAAPAPGGLTHGSATAQPRQRSHCLRPEMQPARDSLFPSWALGDIAHVHRQHIPGSSAARHLGTRGMWPPAMGHHQAARTSQRPLQAQRMLQLVASPSQHWDGASLQLCSQGEELPRSAAPQHSALQPHIPGPILPERGRALRSQDEGTGADGLPRALPALLAVEPGEPWQFRAQPRLPQSQQRGGSRRAPGAGCAGPMGWEGGGCRTGPVPTRGLPCPSCSICPSCPGAAVSHCCSP